MHLLIRIPARVLDNSDDKIQIRGVRRSTQDGAAGRYATKNQVLYFKVLL
jgi:hypothetical protein